jgi:SCY1-like protein 2
MGNQILTKYDVQKEPCYYSTELKWRLHSANFKDRPDDKLTIFLFEKKAIEKYAKNAKENILEVLRKDAANLQKLRHPMILSVVEALVEERSTLAFATKPVVGTVAQLLEHNRHELSSLEMKCGLLDVAEGIQFLHQDAKVAHLGICPHSVFIDPQGRWLLGSLGNSLAGVQWGTQVDCPFAFSGQDGPGSLSHEPPARYAAPEMCQMPGKCGLESDIFALGLLTYEIMSSDRQPLLRGAPRGYSVNSIRQTAVPQELYATLLKILDPVPANRMTIAAFVQSEFFMDVNLRAIRFLEQLHEKDEAQRVTFLKGLPKLLADPQSPICAHRVLRERVLPRLCSALLFPTLFGSVVPTIIAMLKREKVTDSQHFQAKLWPHIRPLFSAKEIPIEVVSLFLRELDILITLCATAETQAVLLPFVLRCLELQEPVILNEVLEKVPLLHKKFEYRQVKDQVLPRMLQLLLSSANVKVKVQVLMGLSRIFEIFDKTTITDVILTAFEKLTKSDRTPAVCMCMLGCYDAMSKHLGHKVTAERILPLIFPLLVEESLSGEQWETQFTVAKKLMQRVEAARRKEYAMKGEQQAEASDAAGMAKVESGNVLSASAEASGPMDFESLLFAGTAKAKAAPPAAPLAPPAAKAAAPPPPAAKAAAPLDLLGGGAPPAPAPPAPMGGFDPFATASTPAVSLTSGGFDPFQNTAPAAPAPGGGMPLGGGPANLSALLAPAPGPAAGGAALNMSAFDSMMPGIGMQSNPGGYQGGMMAGSGMPGMAGATSGMAGGMPGMTGMPGAAGMQGTPGGLAGLGGFGLGAATDQQKRNMNYDPFADIGGRGC